MHLLWLRLQQKPQIKEHDKVITKDAISDEGLFTAHRVDKKYYLKSQQFIR
jgi:hypothetical protein